MPRLMRARGSALQAAGYSVSSGYTLKRSADVKFVYRDALWHGADMFGTGVASFGHVHHVHMQNADRWEDYVAALLDRQKGGHFLLAPLHEAPTSKQIYLSDSNILLSRFFFDNCIAEVSDYMPIETGENSHDLVRRAKTVLGELKYRMVCSPRFNYARTGHRTEIHDGVVIFIPEDSSIRPLRLRGTIPIEIVNGDAVAEFSLEQGKSASFVLEGAQPPLPTVR